MIEVYYVYDEETHEDDGTVIAYFYEWEHAQLFVDAYREKHKVEMEEQGYDVIAYGTEDGGAY